jgi:UDP-glucose 4-epimerase
VRLAGRRILVTGAAGFIGSHLADRLADGSAGNQLVLVDDFSVGRRENLAQLVGRPHVRVVEADVRDLARMRELAGGVDVVFHLAVSCLRTSLAQPERSHDVNAGGTLAVCRAAHEARVSRLVYVSSSEVYGSARTAPMGESHPLAPTTVYGASKLAGEAYALAFWHTHGMPVCVVRPFNSYGPREPWAGARAEVVPRFILRLEAGEPPVVQGDGRQTRDFTFVEDTASGLVAAAECDVLVGDIVNLAYGREVSILEIAEILARQCGALPLRVVHAPPRPGDVRRHFADVTKARTLFGFEPRTAIEEGLARTVAWFRSEGIAARPEAREGAGAPNW